MGTSAVILKENQVNDISKSNNELTNLTAPTNEGAAHVSAGDVWVYGDPASNETPAPSLALLYAQGGKLQPDQQLQWQAVAGAVVNAATYHASRVPTDAVCWVGDVGAPGSGPTVGGFASAIVAAPGLGNTIVVAMVDSSDFSGLANATEIFYDGRVYTLDVAGSTFVPAGHLSLVDTDVAASRFVLMG